MRRSWTWLLVLLVIGGCKQETETESENPPAQVDTMATTTEPTVAPPSVDQVFETIRRYFGQLSPGTVAFNVPKEMRVAVTSPVTLRLAPKGESVGEATPSTTTSSVEHVTPSMEVRLDGGDGMDVRSLTKDEQLVAGGGYAEWRWNVTPKRSGQQQLTAVIIAHVRVEGRDQTRQVGSVTRDVTVRFNFGDYIKNHVEWVWGALIVPVAGWLFALFQRRRKARK